MPLFRDVDLRDRARQELAKSLRSSPGSILLEESRTYTSGKTHDIFLSHSYADAEIILGLYRELTDTGRSVYVDWIEDAHLDRDAVTHATAALLRERMKQCKSMLFATSNTSSTSKWMPWELGFFDGFRGRVAILPISQSDTASSNWKGVEYLGIYPYLTKDRVAESSNDALFVNRSGSEYVSLKEWIANATPNWRR